MERAVAGDDAVFLGAAGLVVIFAHHLDGAFERLGAGIAEEHRVGEGVGDQAVGEALLAGDVEEVRGVPERLDLLAQRGDEMRVGMAEHGDGDAGGEIEIFPPVAGEEIGALAPFKGEVVPSISRQYSRDHENSPAPSGACAKRGVKKRTKRRLPSSSRRRERPPPLHHAAVLACTAHHILAPSLAAQSPEAKAATRKAREYEELAEPCQRTASRRTGTRKPRQLCNSCPLLSVRPGTGGRKPVLKANSFVHPRIGPTTDLRRRRQRSVPSARIRQRFPALAFPP